MLSSSVLSSAERVSSSPVYCRIETLEARQLLSASLQVQNMDIIPGYERMIFNKIGQLDTTVPNKVKDTGVLRLKNVGDTSLTISSTSVSGPFKVVSGMPSSIAPGGFADVTVRFTATAPPKFTYNQTAGFTKPSAAGTYVGSLKFNTNDPKNPTWTEGLAGWYQSRSEDNQEPNLQTMINLIMDYKTNIAPSRTVTLGQGSTPTYYGEEVASPYWQRVDPNKSVFVRQIAAFHGQGDNVPLYWHTKGSTTARHLFTHDGKWGQSFLPKLLNSSAPAAGSFAPTSTFGFRIDTEWGDDKLNGQKYGGGHHVRFYPVRDHFGNILANTYFMVGDYSNVVGPNGPNYDFQDNVYIVSNVKPAGTVTSPPPTSPPPTSPPPTSPPPPTSGTTPRVSISPTTQSVFEGTSGTKAVSLRVSLDNASTKTVGVYYTTANAGATKGSDYVGAGGLLSFSPGQTSKTVTVNVIGDTVAEGDEAFNVVLYGASNATLGTTTGKVIIKNGAGSVASPVPVSPPASPPSSGTPRVSIGPAVINVLEGNSGTKAVTFTVSVDRNPSSAVNFYYTTANGGAKAGSDYNAAAGSLAFYKNGQSSKTITVYVRGDTTKEVTEDFFVNLYGIRGGAFGSKTGKVTIANND